MPTSNTLLHGLTNIGPAIAARLEAVGIKTVGDLRRIGGPAAAYNLVKANNPGKTIPVCYYLYSLQGALDGIHWDALPEKTKKKLLHEIQ
ncbi:MAG: TfoX/Sxy family DNA transformation protein [Nitrospira sp.]|nr:TfoX/Sxy family DNA transformation protein [Nitrospira sp.]